MMADVHLDNARTRLLAGTALAALAVASGALGQTGQELDRRQWDRLVLLIQDKARRDFAIQEIDQLGRVAVKRLVPLAGLFNVKRARPILYALSELAHNGAGELDGLVRLERRVSVELLPELLEVELAFLPFLESANVQPHVSRITKLAGSKIRQENKDLCRRFGRVCQIANQLGELRSRPSLGVDLSTEELVGELRTGMGVGDRAEVAARLLSRRGKEARMATKKLIELLHSRGNRFPAISKVARKDAEPIIHRWAAVALTKIVPGSRHSIEAHGYLLLFGNDREMRDAIREIRLHTNHGKAAVPYLVKGLSDGDKWRRDFSTSERVELITTLGIIGAGAVSAVPRLVALASQSDRHLARAAESALRSIRPSRRRVIR